MATKVHMEALSPTMEEGQLVRWLKQEGDSVSEGDVLAEIETDKATMELVARGSGVLGNVTLKEGDTAAVGSVIAVIAAEGEEVDGAGSGDNAPSHADGAGAKPDDSDAADDVAQATAGAVSREPKTGGSEQSGRPEKQESKTPESVRQGSGARGGEGPEGSGSGQASGENGRAGGRIKASPLARRLAEEAGVDLAQVEGSGPGGRITKRDIEAAQSGAGEPRAPAGGGEVSEQAADAGVRPALPADADSEQVPVSQMRKTIAKRLATSIGPIPTFYLTIECDVTRLMELRKRTNEALEKQGVRTSVNDFIIRAVAAALAQHPEVNASWGDNAITRHHRVHIGVAVAVEDGLITPIVRDADRKRVRDISTEVKELAGRAREKKLKPEEYTGATFSISNLGMFGIVEFTAIINPPEAGILAVGAVEEKVVVENGEMVVRPRMRMTMSCDHRVIDGATGAKFLQTVQQFIEDPVSMLA